MCVSPPPSEGKLLGESQISLMSLEVMQNSCVFTCSWVKPGAQTERERQKGLVIYDFAEAGTLAATGHPDPLLHFLGRSGYFQWEKLKHQICSLEH